ncbi:hypothetical protein BDW22DRAFT_1351492 [Trametopsis cervina]|nr:hypothetical protein BDW22DRAFT_1351492 [Trametopsis cervina]
MGNFISKYLDDSAEKEEKVKEQLEIMMKLADARLDNFQTELEMMFVNPTSAMKRSIPGKRAIRFERSVRVDCGSEGSPGVSEAVDSFFNVGQGGKQSILDGFKSIVNVALKAALGDTTAGEAYDKKFFVCIHHNAIVRVDFYSYRYNFANEGLVSTHKNVFAYMLCTSVVDHRVVTPDELVFLASEFAGDEVDGQHFEVCPHAFMYMQSSGIFLISAAILHTQKYIHQLLAVWESLQNKGPTNALSSRVAKLLDAPEKEVEGLTLQDEV